MKTEVEKMSGIRTQYYEGFKKNAVKLSYANPKSIAEVPKGWPCTKVVSAGIFVPTKSQNVDN